MIRIALMNKKVAKEAKFSFLFLLQLEVRKIQIWATLETSETIWVWLYRITFFYFPEVGRCLIVAKFQQLSVGDCPSMTWAVAVSSVILSELELLSWTVDMVAVGCDQVSVTVTREQWDHVWVCVPLWPGDHWDHDTLMSPQQIIILHNNYVSFLKMRVQPK